MQSVVMAAPQVEGQLEIFMGHLGISAEQFLAATTVATTPTSVHKVI